MNFSILKRIEASATDPLENPSGIHLPSALTIQAPFLAAERLAISRFPPHFPFSDGSPRNSLAAALKGRVSRKHQPLSDDFSGKNCSSSARSGQPGVAQTLASNEFRIRPSHGPWWRGEVSRSPRRGVFPSPCLRRSGPSAGGTTAGAWSTCEGTEQPPSQPGQELAL